MSKNSSSLQEQTSIIKIEIHKIYYTYTLISLLVTFLGTLNKPLFSEILTFLLIVGTLSVYGLISNKARQSEEFFNAQIIIHTIILALFKFSVVNSNASGPMQIMLELALSITSVYYYGMKLGFWVPLLFILTSYYRLFLIEYDPTFEINIIDPPGGRLIIIGFILMIYTTVFSGLFSHKIAGLLDKNEKNNISLDIASIKLQAQNKALEETFEKLEDAAVINSHRLRAPIARIKGLIIIYNEIKDLDLSEDDPIAAISLKNEILNSIDEFNVEYQHLKELINK